MKSRLAGAAHPADRDFFLSDIAGVPGRSPEIIPRQQTVMEEALAATRQAINNDEAGETTLAPTEPRTSREQAGAKPISEAGLLSREATAAVGSAFNTLTETVKKHEPTLEDVVGDMYHRRPMLDPQLERIA